MIRTKKIMIIIISVSIAILLGIALVIFAVLNKNTDLFKSSDTLFIKYFLQNLDTLEVLGREKMIDESSVLENSKYVSDLEGKIKYIKNIGTSSENRNSPINDVGIKIKSNVDKSNNYSYRDISIGTYNEDLVKLEIANEAEKYGLRLKGIQQFVSTNNKSELLGNTETENIKKITELNISSLFKFSDEEKQKLKETYLDIIKNNISKDKYFKQKNALITVDDKDVKTDSYYIKLTLEEYNDLCIKILEQIENDEIILSRIEELQKKISTDDDENSISKFKEYIDAEIENIRNNNIGNDEVRITVYENNQKLVRTSIEKSTKKLNIDYYEDSSIKIYSSEMSDTIEENSITVKKENTLEDYGLLIQYNRTIDGTILNNVNIDYKKTYDNNEIDTQIEVELSNEKYSSTIQISNNVKLVEEFEDNSKFISDNIDLDSLEEEKRDVVIEILKQNLQEQLQKLFSVVTLNDYIEMITNIGVISDNSMQLPTVIDGITDIEKNRFNTQFEFFESKNLTTDNIKELLQVAQNNLEDIKVKFNTGIIEDLDINKINSDNYEEAKAYKDSIEQIIFIIKEGLTNDKKYSDINKLLETDDYNIRYDINIQYDEDGLVRTIGATIKNNN